jgi:hypothetical protein
MLKYILFGSVISCSQFTSAQVHVRDEPRHHNVFENEFVRILDVHLGPNDTTLYHLHNTPSVFIIFTNTNVGSQLWGKPPQKGANVNGIIDYDSIVIPRIHRVWNEDTSWFHVMDVELTSIKQKNNIAVLQNPSLKLLFNEQQANGYNGELKPGNLLEIPASVNGYLLVSQTESVLEFKVNEMTHHRILKPAHYLWVEPSQHISLKATGNRALSFVLLQLK